MIKRSVHLSLAVAMLASLALLPLPARSGTASAVRPDAWIKLCGSRAGCTEAFIPRTPYKGNNIYNDSGWHQTVSGKMDEGTDIRFWFVVQNDGASQATFTIQGCHDVWLNGQAVWTIRQVVIGAWTVGHYRPRDLITDGFKHGTARVKLDPGARQVYTLDVWNRIRGVGRVLRCPITVSSKAQPDIKDTVVARMITY
jgi:hypothetical protein